MSQKYKVLIAFFWVFLVLTLSVCTYGVDTRDIDAVRSKAVLDNSDLQTIDRFVAQALDELVQTKDFGSIANARSIILACSSSKEGVQEQYAQQFCESAKKHIGSAMSAAEGLSDEGRKAKVIANLLILVDGLADVRLADLALQYVKSNNKVIRYWAVHSVTNNAILNRLNALGLEGEQQAREIASGLAEIVGDSGPETLSLMVNFSSSMKIRRAEELLLKIADARILQYEDWRVEYELVDADILKAVAKKMNSSNQGRSEAGRRFGQLLSYVFQRYVKGRDYLSGRQKGQLLSVLLETEKSCISVLLKPQLAIKRAIEADDSSALMGEHNRLLGEGTKSGELNIQYSDSSGGGGTSGPAILPDPPMN